MTAGFLADAVGQAAVAAILDRKRLTTELAAADDAHTGALVEAVGGRGDWFTVRQAAEIVRQCRAALKAAGEDHE
jgi:ribosomal protein S19E (S16A)